MIFESVVLNVAVIIILIIALTLDYLTKFFSYWYVRFIPYKTPVPAFGSDYSRVFGIADSTEVANELYNKHSKDKYIGYIKSRIPELIVRDPEVIKYILADHSNSFSNRGLCLENSVDHSLRNNLFFVENELWRALRYRLKAFFESDISLNKSKCISSISEGLPSAPVEIDVREVVKNLTSLSLFECLFGEKEAGNVSREDRELLFSLEECLRKRSLGAKIKNYLMSIFPSLYVLFNISRLKRSVFASIKDVMLKRKGRCFEEDSFLQFLNDQKNEESDNVCPDNKLTLKPRSIHWGDDLSASQVVSLVSEGFIPCCDIISLTLYELAKAPQVLLALHQELDQMTVTSLETDQFSLLNRVIKEVLRLHPPYSLLHRVCVSTYKIPNTDIIIDKGVTIAIPVSAIHRDGTHFDHPDRFDPDRFTEAASGRHPYAYLPFGAGPRRCIGSQLAFRWISACLSGVLRAHTVAPCARTPALALSAAAFRATLTQPAWLRLAPRLLEHHKTKK